MFKYFALGFDYILFVSYTLAAGQFSLLALLAPLLHSLTFWASPHCYVNHCHPQSRSSQSHAPDDPCLQHQPTHEPADGDSLRLYLSPFKISPTSYPKPSQLSSPSPAPFTVSPLPQPPEPYPTCKQCSLTQWTRMQHCYHCSVCVHKYDHHCVLLDVCIGEANQKYYLPFLWVFQLSCAQQILGYYSMVGRYIWLDENGYEHMTMLYVWMSVLIIFCFAAILITGYLALYHSYLALRNGTTYEQSRRAEIHYFRGVVKAYPFSRGVLWNLKSIFMASSKQPIWWDKPEAAPGSRRGSLRQGPATTGNLFEEIECAMKEGAHWASAQKNTR